MGPVVSTMEAAAMLGHTAAPGADSCYSLALLAYYMASYKRKSKVQFPTYFGIS